MTLNCSYQNNVCKKIHENLQKIGQLILAAEKQYGRKAGDVSLLAVSKTKPAEFIRCAYEAGQQKFAENYVQEALQKMYVLSDLDIEWHFIGSIQANKTRKIAEHFDWVHSVNKEKIAHRLNEQRPVHLPPLNICIEVNINEEATKSGALLNDLPSLAGAINEMPNLNLCGLMAIPEAVDNIDEQRESFRQLRLTLDALNRQGFKLDTLSMGMTNDFEAAIAEGATIIRIGTAIFGARESA